MHLFNPHLVYKGDADAERADGPVLLRAAAAAVGCNVAPPRRRGGGSLVPIPLTAGEDGPAGAMRGLVHRGRAALAVHGEARGRLPRAAKRREELDQEEKNEDTAAGEG